MGSGDLRGIIEKLDYHTRVGNFGSLQLYSLWW